MPIVIKIEGVDQDKIKSIRVDFHGDAPVTNIVGQGYAPMPVQPMNPHVGASGDTTGVPLEKTNERPEFDRFANQVGLVDTVVGTGDDVTHPVVPDTSHREVKVSDDMAKEF